MQGNVVQYGIKNEIFEKKLCMQSKVTKLRKTFYLQV